MTLLRWAAIGTGAISRSVVPDLMACEGACVVLVYSRSAEKAAHFAEEFGIERSTSSFDEVLADQSIDALYLATPIALHHEMATRALEAGKHVLIEKPMAMNAEEVKALFEVASRRGVFLMEAMWFKFSPTYVRLMDEISAGTIGEVRNLRASFGIPFPDTGDSSRWDVTRSGATLLDQGIYPVTLAHSVLGEPTSVHAAGTVREDGLDLAEHFTLEFSEGRYAQCASSMTEFSELTASVGGTRGWLTLAAPFWASNRISVHAGGAREIFHAPRTIESEQEGHGYRPMLRAVIAAVEAGLLQHPTHAADATQAVFRTLDAVRLCLGGEAGPPKRDET